MASDYDKITQYNIKQLGEDTETRKTQVCMYSDPTHFVYEILQNADDYGAKTVFFDLKKEKLIIEHDGIEFSEDNVKSVTYFGKSTSKNDLLKTGKFGVGFKSVFAFTATPIVISGDESFEIYELYKVKKYECLRNNKKLTIIILPFNHEKLKPNFVDEHISKEKAYSKISDRLKTLNMKTLLFTKNIREIKWSNKNEHGHYLREDKNIAENIRESEITDGNIVNKFIVFSHKVEYKDEIYKEIDIAFYLDKNNNITPYKDYLYVLFPTLQETHLNFTINGPFRTNPSRETIPEDDEFNKHLINCVCDLFESILKYYKSINKLDTYFLGILPLEKDELRDFYKPIKNRVNKLYTSDEYLMTEDNNYMKAKHLYQSIVSIKKVIKSTELQFFTGDAKAAWIKDTPQNTRANGFISELNIEYWDFNVFIEKLRNKFSKYTSRQLSDNIMWLEKMSDDWIKQLYLLLGELKDKGYGSIADRYLSIIRAVQEGKIVHTTPDKTYFPSDMICNWLPIIKSTIIKNKSEIDNEKIIKILQNLGVKKISESEVVKNILDTYYKNEESKISTNIHMQHIRKFIKFWKISEDIDFSYYRIFKVEDDDEFKYGEECYIDYPIKRTSLQYIYSASGNKSKLSDIYKDIKEEFVKFALSNGAIDDLKIVRKTCYYHCNESYLREDYKKPRVRRTDTCIDEDYTIEEISTIIKNIKKIDVCALLWNKMRRLDAQYIYAKYRPNSSYEIKKDFSTIIYILKQKAWIIDREGNLRCPQDMTKEDLHSSLTYDDRNGWLTAICFGENAKKKTEEYQKRQEMAESLGVDIEFADKYAKMSIEEKAELNKLYDKIKNKKEKDNETNSILKKLSYVDALKKLLNKPGKIDSLLCNDKGMESINPDRRSAKVAEQLKSDILNESEINRISFKMRKVWTKKDANVRKSLENWYAGKCQICDNTFVKRDGKNYYEGFYLVPYINANYIDRPGNIICLCPIHCAMFQYGSVIVDVNIIENIKKFNPKKYGGDGNPCLRVELCGKEYVIKYHEDHMIELKSIIDNA